MSKGKFIKKVIIIIFISTLCISFIFYIGLQRMLGRFSEEIGKIEISEINVYAINDGTYFGKYYVNESVGATVEVTVKNNRIAKINFIEHKYGRGKKAEAIIDKIIQNQTLDVDAISGATGSSKVILKAIEDALMKGLL